MKTRTTIFLSGVSHEFGSFRDAVEVEIQKKGCFADNQPGFAPAYGTVEEYLRRRLLRLRCRDSRGWLSLWGRAEPAPRLRASPLVHADGIRHRPRDAETDSMSSSRNDASLRIRRKPDEAPENADLVALQLAHRKAVQGTNHLYYFFKDKAELCLLAAGIPPVQAAGRMVDVSRIIRYAPSELVGRDDEMQSLDQAWLKVRRAEGPRPRIFTFVALGGEGKTSLVAKGSRRSRPRIGRRAMPRSRGPSIAKARAQQLAASSDLFLKEALHLFRRPGAGGPARRARSTRAGGWPRSWASGGRCSFSTAWSRLQYAPSSPTPGELKDQGIAALLKGLAASSHGLCLVTTRYSIPTCAPSGRPLPRSMSLRA